MLLSAQIRDLRRAVISQRDAEYRRPIRKPVLTKNGRRDGKLNSAQALLGLDITDDDYDDDGGLWAWGQLKQICWKHMLVSFRRVGLHSVTAFMVQYII